MMITLLEKPVLHQKLTSGLKLSMKSNCSIEIQCKDYKLAYEQDSQQNKNNSIAPFIVIPTIGFLAA